MRGTVERLSFEPEPPVVVAVVRTRRGAVEQRWPVSRDGIRALRRDLGEEWDELVVDEQTGEVVEPDLIGRSIELRA